MMPDRCLEVCRRAILINAQNVNHSRADHEDQIKLKKAIKVYKKIDAQINEWRCDTVEAYNQIRDEAKDRAERLRTQRAGEKPEKSRRKAGGKPEHSQKRMSVIRLGVKEAVCRPSHTT